MTKIPLAWSCMFDIMSDLVYHMELYNLQNYEDLGSSSFKKSNDVM
jgi:hypothetical protein